MKVSRNQLPKILVVDDLQENIDLVGDLLGPSGFSIRATRNGEDALAMVADWSPDAVLLDLLLPGMDGFEICRRIKQNPRTQFVPVIIMTGLAEREANIKAFESGADDFIVKPLDALLLEARLRSVYRAKLIQDELVSYKETLESRVSERAAQLERTQQVAVFSLAKLAESRDTETGAHLERMRCYVRTLASEYRDNSRHGDPVDQHFVDQLYQSSPLHDIGKVGIPDGILLKQAGLTSHEYDIMKVHALIGGDTLRAADMEAGQASFLAMGRDIAYYHHERWDGTGYPIGLEGDAIPLAARMVALADVYDALTSRRPYKEAFSHQKSRELILSGSGTQFDPDVVAAFQAREQDFIKISRIYPDVGKLPPYVELVSSLGQIKEREQRDLSVASAGQG